MNLTEYINDRSERVPKENKTVIQQLSSLLDMETDVPCTAIHKVVQDEITDIQSLLATELANNSNIAEQYLPDLSLNLLNSLKKEGFKIQPLIDRYSDLDHRVRYMMQPSTYEEIQNLDPKKDCDQIYHFISYDFRLEQKLFANLFEGRPTVIPTGALLFHSTGEFTLRAVKRINDTATFFANMLEWGLTSRRGRETLEKMNGIHGRYHAGTDIFKFILGNIMFVPSLWNSRLGWRPLTEIENSGWYHAFARLGRAMNIHDIPDDREEMRQWWLDFSAISADSTPVQRKTFDEIVLQVLSVYPQHLRRFALNALLCGMDDLYRNALGYPAPPPSQVEELRQVFQAAGRLGRMLPRIPWMRSLQTYPLGFSIERLGVNQRSKFMPRLSDQGDNKGYPSALKPLRSGEGEYDFFDQLPVIEDQELARHTSTNDAWLAIGGVIYDVTSFLLEHPGGGAPLQRWLGKDCTEAFARIDHSAEARSLMLNFRVGRLRSAVSGALPGKPQPMKKVRPSWQPQTPVSVTEWNALLDALLAAVDAYEEGILKQQSASNGPVAAFPVQLPSHSRPQGMIETA